MYVYTCTVQYIHQNVFMNDLMENGMSCDSMGFGFSYILHIDI